MHVSSLKDYSAAYRFKIHAHQQKVVYKNAIFYFQNLFGSREEKYDPS